MITEPSQPQASQSQEGTSSASAEGDPRREELFGPLALVRMHKDDGRLLIVFRDAEASGR